MKIKTWLLSSYLVVMILPLLAAYLLFAWIQSFNNDLQVGEYLNKSASLQEVIAVLEDPELYQGKVKTDKVEEVINKHTSITLYNQEGLVVYTSNPVDKGRNLKKKDLYQDLYELEAGYRVYMYKQPVFQAEKIVGFFEVQMARDEWMAGVERRSWFTLAMFGGLFLLIYIVVIWLVNQKLNKRLTGLMNEMSAFADGKKLTHAKENNDEIGILTRKFYEMAEQINDAQAVIEEEKQQREYMIATLSHDLKTPLTSIKAYAESLEEDANLTTLEKEEYRQVIIEKSDFIKQMLDDLLTYALLESPSYEMEFVQVDGNEFFEMLVSDYEPLCKQKNIQLCARSEVAGDYKVNPKQLIRSIDNLVSNAIRHTNKGGKIWIHARSHKGCLSDWLYEFVHYEFDFTNNSYLIVQNEGKGIPANKLAYIFEPLYQTDQARSKKDAHGTGLGLSITKRMIEQHGGNVQMFSQEEIGTCVICALPKIKKKDEDVENHEKY